MNRRSILGSMVALVATPIIAHARDDEKGMRPDYIFARHPRHRALDCYHPAMRNLDGEVWYTDSIGCWTAEEAKDMAVAFLAMKPSPFYRMTRSKATGPTVVQIDYIARAQEA